MIRTIGVVEIEDVAALLELAARAPKSQTEQRWLDQFAARMGAAGQETTTGHDTNTEGGTS